MKKYSLVRKYSTIGVIFLFMGTSIVPSIQSEFPSEKNIITVDDEPGDADFTSIKEAVIFSNPGDTIEVYSGTYPEQEIHIENDNIALLGIAHELGGGDDDGRPFIKGNVSLGTVLRVEASQVLISNFLIENSNGYNAGCIETNEQNNITISDCIIHTKKDGDHPNTGIGVRGNHIKIINNEINYCNPGISARTDYPLSLTITGNIITDCGIYGGISLHGNQQNVSGNRIRRCGEGIRIFGTNNTIFGNDIDNCPISVCSPAFNIGEVERGNTFIKNNFKNYSRKPWWDRHVIFFLFYGFVTDKKDTWIGNYWDTWIRVGPHRIFGWFGVGIVFAIAEGGIGVNIPWFEYDRHPAKKPHDIP
jgi:parallel beta-helix repeat protein